MSERDIAVIVSLRIYDCTTDGAVDAFRDFLAESGGIPAGNDGEVEVLDVNLLFPRKACGDV